MRLRRQCIGAIGGLRTQHSVRRMSRTFASFRGVYPIMVTPFHSDETLDLVSFQKSVDFMRRAGVDGVTIIGVLGESNRLLDSERDDLIRAAVDASQGLPVIVGTSHPGTRATAELSARAEKLGAAGVMVTPSREPTPLSEQSLVDYFKAVESATSLPIILQDHPASTQVHMPIPTIARLVREVQSVACIKLESLPSPPRIAQLSKLMDSDGRKATILTGLGALYGAFDLMESTDGFMTGFAFPEALIAMVRCAKDEDALFRIYQHWLPLMVFEQQPGLAIRKEVYRLRGLLESGHVRHPGTNIGDRAAETLEALIRRTVPEIDIREPLPQGLLRGIGTGQ